MTRLVPRPAAAWALLAAGLVAACAPLAPPPAPRPRSAVEEACRREADRTVLFRDRGQTMRIDEGEARVGVQANIPTVRAQSDRLAQQFERDRLAAECVQANTGEAAPPAPAPQPPRP